MSMPWYESGKPGKDAAKNYHGCNVTDSLKRYETEWREGMYEDEENLMHARILHVQNQLKSL